MKRINSLVSVIIPYYNRSHTILRCLRSVFDQTYKNIEIIIVNDNSSDWDKAQIIIDSIGDYSIKVVHHVMNLNGSTARNTGVLNSNGEYIAFLDSDDEWVNDYIEKCVNFIEQFNEEEVVLFSEVLLKTGSFEKPTSVIMNRIEYDDKSDISDYLFVNDQIIQTSAIFTTKYNAQKYKFNEKLIRFQDVEYVLRLSKNNVSIKYTGFVGAIVHWEGDVLNRIKKTVDIGDYAFTFSKIYREYFSQKSYKHFLIKKVIPLYLSDKQRLKSIKLIVTEKLLFELSFPIIIKIFVSTIIGNNITIRQKVKEIYYFLNGNSQASGFN